MRSRSENSPDYRRTIAECGLPSAPMSMPEQELIRERTSFFAPVLNWLVAVRRT